MQRGFTLIEMLVSVAIFTVVMTISLGALLTMSEADRRAEAMNAAVNNLSFALDSMSRAVRTGTAYHCGSTGVLTQPQNCAAGANELGFLSASGVETVYTLGTTACPNGQGCIWRSTDGGVTYQAITAPEVVVTNLVFYVVGAALGDGLQPKATMLVSGHVPVSNTQASFNIETSVTQRLYDQ